jgi:hypothetical protein
MVHILKWKFWDVTFASGSMNPHCKSLRYNSNNYNSLHTREHRSNCGDKHRVVSTTNAPRQIAYS